MTLTPEQLDALRDAAERNGLNLDDLIGVAETMTGDDNNSIESGAREPGELPLNERLLIGHLPYITVNELRVDFMGLPKAPDGELFTGEWLLKHGGLPDGEDA